MTFMFVVDWLVIDRRIDLRSSSSSSSSSLSANRLSESSFTIHGRITSGKYAWQVIDDTPLLVWISRRGRAWCIMGGDEASSQSFPFCLLSNGCCSLFAGCVSLVDYNSLVFESSSIPGQGRSLLFLFFAIYVERSCSRWMLIWSCRHLNLELFERYSLKSPYQASRRKVN